MVSLWAKMCVFHQSRGNFLCHPLLIIFSVVHLHCLSFDQSCRGMELNEEADAE